MSDDEECKLTLMLAELVNDDDEANGLAAARMTVAVEVGKAAHLDTAEGKSVDFKCLPGGQEMSIEVIEPGRILAPKSLSNNRSATIRGFVTVASACGFGTGFR